MATPHEKLTASLTALQSLQRDGRRVFQSKDLKRIDRERLVRNGFLREVMKGWLISTSPNTDSQDSTPWFASFWEFCGLYSQVRFGDQWHLSPEQSLMLHAENTAIPAQVIVYSPKGTNNKLTLLFGTSLYDLKQKRMPERKYLVARDGLRLFTPEAALVRVPESFFTGHPVEAGVVLARTRDASDVLGPILDGGHSVVAGRLAGAYRHLGKAALADEIVSAMKSAGYDVRESDPFAPQQTFTPLRSDQPPIVGRLRATWEISRDHVIEAFPKSPGLPGKTDAYLRLIDGIYKSDAYHSLSIEGYRVTPELIERVQGGDWNPETNESDRERRDALAARGYWQAFRLVKASVAKVLAGENPGALVRDAHREWYRELFEPCVAAGLMRASALAGYRNDAVFLHGSRHVPPRWDVVRDVMPALFDLLEEESEPPVRAVLGHWMFGYIHPYFDGNGRMARFLMNAMLASGGYPWTVIQVEDRDGYMAALESASVDMDIGPFAAFIAERVRWSMEHDHFRYHRHPHGAEDKTG